MNYLRPPKAIIYSQEMEPITAIDMSTEMYNYFETYDIVRFPVMKPINPTSLNCEGPFPKYEQHLIAEIRAVRILDNSSKSVITLLFTNNEETALLMKTTILPGQVSHINYLKSQAFAKGMLEAIKGFTKK